jgi:sulfite oxidase
MLIWEMNGKQLPVEHGGPVRVVVPGHIGARRVQPELYPESRG